MKPFENVTIRFFRPQKGKSYECIITDDNINERFIGRSKTHCNDKYNKEMGRKLSLSRALKASPFSKEQRTTIWGLYRTQPKAPRW